MMLGIGKEASIFLYAVLTGVVTFSAYQILVLFRKLIPHHIAAVNVEDFCFGLESAPTYFGKCIRQHMGVYAGFSCLVSQLEISWHILSKFS